MSLLNRFNNFTTGTPLRIIISSLLITILIPVTLFANTQNLELRRKAAEQTIPTPSPTDQLLQTAEKYKLASPKDKNAILSELITAASERKKTLLQEIESDPATFLKHVLPAEERNQLPQELKDQGLIERDIETKGKLTVIVSDDFENEQSTITYRINDFNLHFAQNPPDLFSGSEITAKGVALDSELVLEQGQEPNLQTVSAASPTTTGEITTAVILFNFTNNRSQPFAPKEVASVMFSANDSVDAFYQENSFGQVSFPGDVLGWYEIDFDNSGCQSNYDDWAAAADVKAAQEDDIDVENYTRKVYVFPQTPCPFHGQTYLGGDRVWINGYNNPSLFAHELGHTLGVRHAGLIECALNRSVDVYSNCNLLNEYGDIYDVMGSNWAATYHFNAPHKVEVGWIPTDRIQTITESGTYTIPLLEEVRNSEIQALRIQKPNTSEYYYLGYRQPVGFDTTLPNGITRGVSIHIRNEREITTVRFVDAAPETARDFTDAALTDGASFYDHLNDITITQLNHDANSVTVRIDLPESPPISYYVPFGPKGTPGPGWDTAEEFFTILDTSDAVQAVPIYMHCYDEQSRGHNYPTYWPQDFPITAGGACLIWFNKDPGPGLADFFMDYSPVESVAYKLHSGRNLMSVPENLLNSLTAERVCQIINYQGGSVADIRDQADPEDIQGLVPDYWTKHICGQEEDNFTIKSGRAYYIMSNTDSSWILPFCVPGYLLPGDLDCDCDVDIVDIMMVAVVWNTREGDDKFRPEFDFDGDGRISIADIMYVAAKWNTRCTP
jgi:hypothetical protein